MEDVIVGFASIENSAAPVFEDLNDTELVEECIDKVRKNLELVVTSIENRSYGTVQKILQFTLNPNVKKLKERKEELYQPYVLS